MELADEAQARQLLDAVAACAWRIDDKFSRYRTDNVVARINASRCFSGIEASNGVSVGPGQTQFTLSA